MDLGFFRRGIPQGDMSAQLDYRLLTTSLQAYQTTSATARAEAKGQAGAAAAACPQDALVEILLGGPRWREAVDEQGGSFNASRARPGAGDA